MGEKQKAMDYSNIDREVTVTVLKNKTIDLRMPVLLLKIPM